ncbi:HAMP domain-containing histidine kinase [Novosphingobium umbonatum]|uniref:histidine kinase n=1 Tax=Novosphingobium umbonatum TaxID=1908524 RepID=A0A3S2URD3_9SPHN|nr:HAMP domain-containing sensor histidine kinase [Novosphingobium umbonatum]RVU04954.1 HAMP domain-containing histidine kinase [Novosphingobium umbonatum]
MRDRFNRLMPKSLTGQVLMALALALLLAQGISAALLYQAKDKYREEQLIHELALKATIALRHRDEPPPMMEGPMRQGPDLGEGPRGPRPEMVAGFQTLPVDQPCDEYTHRLTQILAGQDIGAARVLVVERPIAADPLWNHRIAKRYGVMGNHGPPRPTSVLVGAVQMTAGGPWLVVRTSVPPNDPWLLVTLILQTLLIYAVLVGTMALILRRIARPLAALTHRVDHFAQTREAKGQITPEGPEDVRRLIVAHNALEERITALINEKDVMLGAIGHDLKTPLAALRVRIECVDDDAERDKMAKTIEDIVRSLDDILSLARVGRPSDPVEPTELSALVASIVEEYEDMGDDVVLDHLPRLVMPSRATWLRRALRNLIGNALRYSGSAAVTMERVAEEGRDWAVICVSDCGKGIPDGDIERMFQPFTRGEPSRNMATGGAGLGLTLARAIAEQHGGRLVLANRMEHGAVGGLDATLWLPLSA